MTAITGFKSIQAVENERDRCLSNPFLRLPLAQTVDRLKGAIDLMGPYHAARLKKEAVKGNKRIPLKELSPQKITLPQTIFRNSHMETVPDDCATPLKLNQIKKSDAEYFLHLYNEIREGRTKLKISGPDEFRDAALKHIASLLTRPSGRRLIGSICSLGRQTVIRPAPRSTTRMVQDDSRVFVRMNFKEKTYSVCMESNKQIGRAHV